MAAEPTSEAGSTHIFQELDAYPWDQDTEFQVSRSSISNFKLQPRLSVTERDFQSLKEAKTYVQAHFQSGAEYFSLKQSANPDNFLHIIIDKIKYLIA